MFNKKIFSCLSVLVGFAAVGLAISTYTNAKSCGSASGGPTENPIAKRYGKQTYTWTDEIKWQCVYNINDFKGNTLVNRFNAARDAAKNNGGGVVYFPKGTYQFTDSIYLKSGVVIRGEALNIADAKLSKYSPLSRLEFPKYQPTFSGGGTLNNTAFKKILAFDPNNDSNIGVVDLDINRAGIYFLANISTDGNQNIVVYGIRSNNVSDLNPFVPAKFQSRWLRYPDLFGANIKINALKNVLVANNRLNDATTDNYDQPNYQVKSLDNKSIVTYSEGWKVPFDYANHYGIVVNRSKAKIFELSFKPHADPVTEPGLFREGITIRDNWIYHTMRAGIRASGEGLVVQDNQIRDKPVKQWWTDRRGLRLPFPNETFENRAIDWSGQNVLIQGNEYEVYRHRLFNSDRLSVDGEGILIQECCGGTKIDGAKIEGNSGNSYIGLFWTPFIQNVSILKNKLLTNNNPETPLIYVYADLYKTPNAMYNVQVEDNIINGSMLLQASLGGRGNVIKNNVGNRSGFIQYSCSISINKNSGFAIRPCLPTSPPKNIN